MRLSRRTIMSAAALALIASPVGAAEVVNIYNSRHYGTDQQLWDGFTKATGIQVNVVDGTHEQLIQRMQTEGANSPADVFITVDAGRLAQASGLGLLQPIKSPMLEAKVPAHLRDPDGLWYGWRARAGLVYAKDRVDPAQLSTYEALADPRFKGKVLVRSSTNVYNLSLSARSWPPTGPRPPRHGARAWSPTWRGHPRAATPTRSRPWRPAWAMSPSPTPTTSPG